MMNPIKISLYRSTGRSLYSPSHEMIELDDTYVGGKKPGKRGRGAGGKKSVLVAIEEKRFCASYSTPYR